MLLLYLPILTAIHSSKLIMDTKSLKMQIMIHTEFPMFIIIFIVDRLSRSSKRPCVLFTEDPNDSIHLSAGYVNDTAIQAEIYRKVSQQRIPESWIAVRLNSSHILHTRVTWRPSSLMELQQFVSSKALVYSYVMNEAASEVSQAMGQEVTAKYNRIANEIFNEMKPVFTLLEKEMANAKVNLDLVQREVRRAYRRNDLYIKDMGNAVNSAFNQIL